MWMQTIMRAFIHPTGTNHNSNGSVILHTFSSILPVVHVHVLIIKCASDTSQPPLDQRLYTTIVSKLGPAVWLRSYHYQSSMLLLLCVVYIWCSFFFLVQSNSSINFMNNQQKIWCGILHIVIYLSIIRMHSYHKCYSTYLIKCYYFWTCYYNQQHVLFCRPCTTSEHPGLADFLDGTLVRFCCDQTLVTKCYHCALNRLHIKNSKGSLENRAYIGILISDHADFY